MVRKPAEGPWSSPVPRVLIRVYLGHADEEARSESVSARSAITASPVDKIGEATATEQKMKRESRD